jgi:hypothetical protein
MQNQEASYRRRILVIHDFAHPCHAWYPCQAFGKVHFKFLHWPKNMMQVRWHRTLQLTEGLLVLFVSIMLHSLYLEYGSCHFPSPSGCPVWWRRSPLSTLLPFFPCGETSDDGYICTSCCAVEQILRVLPESEKFSFRQGNSTVRAD